MRATELSVKQIVKHQKVAKRKKEPSGEEEGWCTDLWRARQISSWKSLPGPKSNLEHKSVVSSMRRGQTTRENPEIA